MTCALLQRGVAVQKISRKCIDSGPGTKEYTAML